MTRLSRNCSSAKAVPNTTRRPRLREGKKRGSLKGAQRDAAGRIRQFHTNAHTPRGTLLNDTHQPVTRRAPLPLIHVHAYPCELQRNCFIFAFCHFLFVYIFQEGRAGVLKRLAFCLPRSTHTHTPTLTAIQTSQTKHIPVTNCCINTVY
uniref:Uncharacterized protein n=1 Tax=Trypanosoma congolense (strain IL3000) TaxID=1068625 RepID=G0UQP2_TRYCI|nr:hypothetical protein, unlikely [Trypanosoma congolense IL3000]